MTLADVDILVAKVVPELRAEVAEHLDTARADVLAS
jgi:hypothetical protein